jgi:hypothetical protein
MASGPPISRHLLRQARICAGLAWSPHKHYYCRTCSLPPQCCVDQRATATLRWIPQACHVHHGLDVISTFSTVRSPSWHSTSRHRLLPPHRSSMPTASDERQASSVVCYRPHTPQRRRWAVLPSSRQADDRRAPSSYCTARHFFHEDLTVDHPSLATNRPPFNSMSTAPVHRCSLNPRAGTIDHWSMPPPLIPLCPSAPLWTAPTSELPAFPTPKIESPRRHGSPSHLPGSPHHQHGQSSSQGSRDRGSSPALGMGCQPNLVGPVGWASSDPAHVSNRLSLFPFELIWINSNEFKLLKFVENSNNSRKWSNHLCYLNSKILYRIEI